MQDTHIAMAAAERINTKIIEMLAENCGKDEAQVRKDTGSTTGWVARGFRARKRKGINFSN